MAPATTPIHDACKFGDISHIKQLLDENSALIHERDAHGETPLHWVSAKGFIDCVVELVDRGAQLDAIDDTGRSALHWAIDSCNLDCVQVLLAHGASATIPDRTGQTPLHLACRQGEAMVEEINKHTPREAWCVENEWGESPMLLAQIHIPHLLARRTDSICDSGYNEAKFPQRNGTLGEVLWEDVTLSQHESDNSMSGHGCESFDSHVPILECTSRIGRCLGKGGFATVWEYETRSGELVALKLAQNERCSMSIQNEIRILSGLSHPNLIRIRHDFREDNRIGYTMDLCQENLRQRLKRASLSLMERLLIAFSIARGLLYLHDHDTAHNDVKPKNILLDGEEEVGVRLIDFGASSKMRSTPRSATAMQITPNYAAPERLRGDRYSIKSDVYSFGVLLNELLGGGRPFSKVDNYALYYQVAVQHRRPEIAEGISKGLRELITSCWTADPSSRPSMLEVLVVLESELRDAEQTGHKMRPVVQDKIRDISPRNNIPDHDEVDFESSGALLGSGGFGNVFRGMQLSTNLPVAIKRLRSTEYERQRGHFHREYTIMSQLDHPNVVKVIGFIHNSQSREIAYVMELMDTTLGEKLIGHKLSMFMVLHYAMEIANGLCFLHETGFIHRDIKPENVLIRAGKVDEVKLSDVGCTEMCRNTATVTHAHRTRRYVAPETFRGEPSSFPSDVFAFGILLNQMITREIPYAHLGKKPVLGIKVPAGARPRMANETHEPLRQLIEECWRDDPKERPTMETVKHKLEMLRKELSTEEIKERKSEPILFSRAEKIDNDDVYWFVLLMKHLICLLVWCMHIADLSMRTARN